VVGLYPVPPENARENPEISVLHEKNGHFLFRTVILVRTDVRIVWIFARFFKIGVKS
jgi:hypothetical protein